MTRFVIPDGVTRSVLVIALAIGCGGDDDAQYGPREDDAFVAAMTGTWSATTPNGTTLSMTVCEDPGRTVCAAPTFGRTSDCEEQCHVIRGGGAGASESLATGEGGCSCRGARGELGVRVVLGTDPAAQQALTGVVDVSPEAGNGYGPVRRLFATLPDSRSGRADLSGYHRDGTLVVTFEARALPVPVAAADTPVVFRQLESPTDAGRRP